METSHLIDDGQLLRRVASQDQQALGLLYDRYARVVYALALKTLGSREDAEEVVLDVFGQIWRSAERYDAARGRADAWIFRLARSRAVDRYRKLAREGRARAAALYGALEDPPLEIRGPDLDVLHSERMREVATALGQLPEAQRRALELAYFKGLSHAEIAHETGEPLGTIKTRIRLGLSRLREALASWWKE